MRMSVTSTPDEKLRRHRNKLRIWKRCVRKLVGEGGNPRLDPA
jgi:hypothetical protein